MAAFERLPCVNNWKSGERHSSDPYADVLVEMHGMIMCKKTHQEYDIEEDVRLVIPHGHYLKALRL